MPSIAPHSRRRKPTTCPVHLFGIPAEMDGIVSGAAARDVPVVEDAACALGSSYAGRACGALGRVGCFSFHPRKVITTGEGGLLTTDDVGLAERLRRLRNHGQVVEAGRGRFLEAGLNYRMTDFQAAMGLAQMDRLPAILERRAELVRSYAARLEGWPGASLPREPKRGRGRGSRSSSCCARVSTVTPSRRVCAKTASKRPSAPMLSAPSLTTAIGRRCPGASPRSSGRSRFRCTPG